MYIYKILKNKDNILKEIENRMDMLQHNESYDKIEDIYDSHRFT